MPSIKQSSHIHLFFINRFWLLFGLGSRLISWLGGLFSSWFFCSWSWCRTASSSNGSEEFIDVSSGQCFGDGTDKSNVGCDMGGSKHCVDGFSSDSCSLGGEHECCVADCKLFLLGHDLIFIIKIFNYFYLTFYSAQVFYMKNGHLERIIYKIRFFGRNHTSNSFL